MAWNRLTSLWSRQPAKRSRGQRRPALDSLENRTLLTAGTVLPETLDVALFQPIPASNNGPSAAVSPANDLIQATAARVQYDVDGSGLAAAVIDTGVNYQHPSLGGTFGNGSKVEGGYDFAEKDGDPMATWNHGTAVAGLIASNDPKAPGVAPGADIVALRVFGNDNRGDFNRIADALQWVINHHSEYNISVVNLSVTDGNNYAMDWFSADGGIGQRIGTLVKQLETLNIPVVSAAGNSFSGKQGMGFTAILPDTFSVTASDSADQLVSNAQRLGSTLGGTSATDLTAPGKGLTAPSDGTGYATVEGTSFAAPLVSGAILLLQQIYMSRFGSLPSVDQLETWLKQGADTILDATTGLQFGRLDVAKAASLIPTPTPPAPPEPPAPPVEPPTAPQIVTPPEPEPTKPVDPPVTTPQQPTTPPTDNGNTIVGKDVLPSKPDDNQQTITALRSLFPFGVINKVKVWDAKRTPPKPMPAGTLTPLGTSGHARKARPHAHHQGPRRP